MKSNKPVIVPKKNNGFKGLNRLNWCVPNYVYYLHGIGPVPWNQGRVSVLLKRTFCSTVFLKRTFCSVHAFPFFSKERNILFCIMGCKKLWKNGKERNIIFEEQKRKECSEWKRTDAQPCLKKSWWVKKMRNFMEIQKSQHSLVTKCTYKKFFQKSLKFWDFIGWKIMFLGNNSF